MPPAQSFPLLSFVVLLPVLYLRFRRMAKSRPLSLKRLWIAPALIMAGSAIVLLAPQPRTHGSPTLAGLDWLWLGLAGAMGVLGGWIWGRSMTIVPQHAILMMRGGRTAMLVFGALILLRFGLRTGATSWHLHALLISDVSLVFLAVALLSRSLEISLRARRIIASSKPGL